MLKSKLSVLALTAFLFLFASPLCAQQKRPAAPRKPPAVTKVAEPVLTFDTVLADDNYRLYSEVRNVGTLVRSEGFNSLLEPMVELAAPPKEFATVLKWIKAHADPLAGSRMFAASWPSKKNLPAVLFAIEFASADEAKKFESELRRFLPKLDPKAAVSPSPSTQPAVATPSNDASATNPGKFAQLQIQQTGALILITDKPISFRDLKPRGSRLLAEDPNFALARNRFASDAIFVYADFKAIEKEEREQRQKWEEEEKRRQEQAAANPSPEPMIASDFEEEIIVSPHDDAQLPPAPESPELIQQTASADAAKQAAAGQERIGSLNSLSLSLSMALLGGRAKWPEAVGAALAFEGDSYVVRALVLNTAENKALPLPFLPQIASGQALTPGSPNILPGDVDLFVVLSLDYSQIYDGMIKTFSEQEGFYQRAGLTTKPLSSPFASFEEKVGIKVKDDLLPLLGNEIAIVLPRPLSSSKAPAPEAVSPAIEANEDNDDRRSVRLPEAMPVIAISIKDKDAVKRLIPKMLEGLGLKGANMLAHTEKREDAEIVSYANLFSYAFIGDFLLVTPNAAWTSRAIDSYLSGNTLSSNSRYKNATRWQSSQVQGQVYLSSDFVDSYAFVGKQKQPDASLQSNQTIEPLTYSLANEGLGPLHEVHVPRSLLMMVVAGISRQADESPVYTNESIAKNVLRTVVSAEATFKETTGNGHYGSVDELVAAGLLTKDLFEKYGYKIEVSVLSNKFEATAAPLEYGKSGRRSFYVDESGVLRGGDHAGGPATLSDKPINE